MAVKTYSLAKDGNKKLSEHFRVKEFACRDGSDIVLIDTKLIDILEKIRVYYGLPVKITSGYRTVSYNKSVGGASASYHIKGMAADIVVTGKTPRDMCLRGINLGIKGVGIYTWGIHVDTRTVPKLWYQVKSGASYIYVPMLANIPAGLFNNTL
ncbi:YcbK family protein [Papillibacter cinnamivorans]|uniref:Peptidase M15 n=1 Tax=Papillibacter cinnamivorans DSM 12816 TaxID=1122930 RepID=A0A1W1YUW6_9FIRM|nr:D-Ala-D-Ala carboxypeptidase family metallohydrolase [Papillibacter cinnamivorans]SMC39518.1 Peptidase M15 [Papillibacter cinnamivorans DSM 12816]